MFFKALAASLLTSTVLGHFTLDYPVSSPPLQLQRRHTFTDLYPLQTSRGFSDEMEPNFCGGFNDVEARQPFPLGAGPSRSIGFSLQVVSPLAQSSSTRIIPRQPSMPS